MHLDPLCLFLCFKAACFWSPCSGQWSTSFLRRFFWSFLFLSLARIKQCLPPALDKKSTHPPLFLSILESFSVLFLRAKLGECVALWFALTPPPLKWLTEQKNLFEVCKRARRYNEFGYNLANFPSRFWRGELLSQCGNYFGVSDLTQRINKLYETCSLVGRWYKVRALKRNNVWNIYEFTRAYLRSRLSQGILCFLS